MANNRPRRALRLTRRLRTVRRPVCGERSLNMSSHSSAKRAVVTVAMVLAGIAAAATSALAQTSDASDQTDDEQIVLSGDLIVPSGHSVSTAVSFNGDATVAGTVTETLVVFNGRATITG